VVLSSGALASFDPRPAFVEVGRAGGAPPPSPPSHLGALANDHESVPFRLTRNMVTVVTPQGVQALAHIQSDVARVQEKILAPLTPQEQSQFVHLLSRLVQGHQAD